MQGMSSLAARSAARTASSIESRSTPGMEATGLRAFVPSTTNSGQIRSSDRQHVLAHQAARPVGLAVAARADGEIEAELGRGGRSDRADPGFRLERTAVFDSHCGAPCLTP